MKSSVDSEKSSFMPPNPPPGLGRKPLAAICKAYNRGLTIVLNILESRKRIAAGDQSLKEITEANQVESGAVYHIIREMH